MPGVDNRPATPTPHDQRLILADQVWFWLCELLLALVTVLAILKDYGLKANSPVTDIKRSEESRAFFLGTASVLIATLFSVMFTITTVPSDGKGFLYILTVGAIAYLCMWRGWATNKLIGLKNKYVNTLVLIYPSCK